MEELSPIGWALRPVKRYADFSGRAPRAEYWWYCVAATILATATAFLDQLLGGPIYGDLGPLALVQTVALLIPGAAVTIRRLHDTDRSGWWYVLSLWNFVFLISGSVSATVKSVVGSMPVGLGFVLVLGFLAAVGLMLVFMITRGTEGPNRYGPDPYGRDQLEEVFA